MPKVNTLDRIEECGLIVRLFRVSAMKLLQFYPCFNKDMALGVHLNIYKRLVPSQES